MKNLLTVREAQERDVKAIAELLAFYAEKQIVLARDEADIRHYLGNFVIAEIDGVLRGCTAIRDFGTDLFGNDLLEVRSLVVSPNFQRKGIGRAMLEAVISGLRIKRGAGVRLFALTYQFRFFERLGFRQVDKSLFPEKIWSDCSRCPKKDRCDEIAVLLEL